MNIKQLVLKGIKWVAFANIFRQIMTLISTIILARLLSPDDFGTFAILMLFISFMNMFIGIGTSSAIIHKDNPSNELLSSVFFLNISMGFIFYFIMLIFSEIISNFFKISDLKEYLNIISLTFIITSFSVLHQAILSKEINFKVLSIIELVSIIFSYSIGILAAFNNFGIYSLIIRVLLGTFIVSILLWYVLKWRPNIFFSIKEIKSIFNFTKNLSLFTFINYLSRNSDNFLIGKFIGTSQLGIYNMAYNIMLYPLQNISSVIVKVLFPAMSKIKNNNEKLNKIYLKVIFFISLISFPLMTGLMALSDLFVLVVFGEKWSELSIILFIMAPIGMMQSIITTTGSIYLTKGNTATMLKTGIVNSLVMILSFLIGLPFGIKGVAILYLLANIIMFYPMLNYAWKQINLPIIKGLKVIYPNFLISVVMALIIYILNQFIYLHSEYELLKLLTLIILGLIIYLILIKIVHGDLITLYKEIRNK